MSETQEPVNQETLREQLPPIIALPVIHPDKFADLVGLSPGVVGGWIDRGYLPTHKIGRYTLVNLTELTEQVKQGGVL